MALQRLSEPLAFARTIRQLEVRNVDAIRLSRMLISETVKRQNFIDAFINHVTEPRTVEEFNLGVQSFLRLYVYQTRIAKQWSFPDIREAINIARVARSILGWKSLQEVESYLGELLTQERAVVFKGVADEERIGLETFHPTWFVNYCFRLFGRMEAINMLEKNVQPQPTYVRLNTLKGTENQILNTLSDESIILEKDEQLKLTYNVTGSKQPLTATSSFSEGLFYIQDKASCFAAEVANPRPGMNVLDVCAAPGAKTTYLAQLMQNRGVIYSLDFSIRRMKVWKSEIQRMGIKIAEPLVVDARNMLPLAGKVDLVVLDPPCTSTGTFRKLPSTKWRITPHSIDRMAEIQWQLLNNVAKHVRPGGVLVYSTCSITVEENEMIIEKFLKWHSDFLLSEISPDVGLPGLRGLTECRRLYPHIHQCNGFFIAKLVSESSA